MGLLDTALADGRCWSRVGDCFEVTRKPPGLRVADYKAVPFVPMEAIPQGGQYEPRYDQKPGADITSGTYFERGDLLIAKITPSFENGKQAWVKRLPAPFGYATTEVIPLRPTAAGYDRRLLFFYLLHPEIRSYVSERMEGSTGRQRVPEQVLLDLPYPKLPPDDQQAIADTLERVTLQVDLEEHSARTAAELKRAAMRELFTRGLRGEPQKETEVGPVPESWSVETLSSSVQRPDYGFTASAINEPVGPKFLRITDIQDGAVDWSSVPYCAIDNSALEQKRLADGDIVIARIGATTGKAFIIEDAPEAVFASYMIRVRTLPQILLAKFLYYFMQSDAYWRYIDQNKGARLKGGVNIPVLLAMPIICPTLDEQRDIVAILDAIDRKIELHRKKRAVLEELFKALLHKLMTGEIRVDELDLSALQAPAEPLSPAAEPAV